MAKASTPEEVRGLGRQGEDNRIGEEMRILGRNFKDLTKKFREDSSPLWGSE